MFGSGEPSGSAPRLGGWVVVPVNWHWTSEELAYVINDSGAKALARRLSAAFDAA